MKVPTKVEIRALVDDVEKSFQKQVKNSTGRGVQVYTHAPEELVPRVEEVLFAFREQKAFPVLEKFITHPEAPDLKDVVRELGEARELAP